MKTGRQGGTVVWFNDQKGSGYIAPDAGGLDLYVQRTCLVAGFSTLKPGQLVEFAPGRGPSGQPMAQEVRPLPPRLVRGNANKLPHG